MKLTGRFIQKFLLLPLDIFPYYNYQKMILCMRYSAYSSLHARLEVITVLFICNRIVITWIAIWIWSEELQFYGLLDILPAFLSMIYWASIKHIFIDIRKTYLSCQYKDLTNANSTDTYRSKILHGVILRFSVFSVWSDFSWYQNLNDIV